MTAAALHTQEQQEQKMLAVRTTAEFLIAQAKHIAETPAPLTSADRCLLSHTAELLAQALDDAYTCGVAVTLPSNVVPMPMPIRKPLVGVPRKQPDDAA